jgi:hypothetical protein
MIVSCICKQEQEIEGAGSGSLKVGRIAEEKQNEKIGGLVAVSLNWVKLNQFMGRLTKLSN